MLANTGDTWDNLRLPPYGGSGLKLCAVIMYAHSYRVSLHTEGVD